MTEKTINVELVLDRESYEDTNYGTGVVWSCKGDVKPVPLAKWDLMARHYDIWKAADAPEDAKEDPKQEKLTGGKPQEATAIADSRPFGAEVIDDLSDAQLLAIIKDDGLKVDSRLRGEKLRAATIGALHLKSNK